MLVLRFFDSFKHLEKLPHDSRRTSIDLSSKPYSKYELFGLDNITFLCKNKQMKMRFMEVVL